jgi:hypothetical protein
MKKGKVVARFVGERLSLFIMCREGKASKVEEYPIDPGWWSSLLDKINTEIPFILRAKYASPVIIEELGIPYQVFIDWYTKVSNHVSSYAHGEFDMKGYLEELHSNILTNIQNNEPTNQQDAS